MPSRLPVVISQNRQRSGRASELEEQLVADLIFANGLDVTLIDSLESIAVGSTDHLCLEGLLGDFAILGWESIDRTVQELARLNISGRTAITGLRPDAGSLTIGSSNVLRRIYHYDLHEVDRAQTMLNELRRLFEDRNQKTVGLSISPKRPTRELETSDSLAKIVPMTQILQRPKLEDRPTNATLASTPGSFAPAIPTAIPSKDTSLQDLPDHDEEWDHLDRLVDDLDEAQL